MTGSQVRSNQLMDDLKEKKGPWKLIQEALDHTLCRTHSERGYGPATRQTAECIDNKNNTNNLQYIQNIENNKMQ